MCSNLIIQLLATFRAGLEDRTTHFPSGLTTITVPFLFAPLSSTSEGHHVTKQEFISNLCQR
jgi:hypothetical protein